MHRLGVGTLCHHAPEELASAAEGSALIGPRDPRLRTSEIDGPSGGGAVLAGVLSGLGSSMIGGRKLLRLGQGFWA